MLRDIRIKRGNSCSDPEVFTINGKQAYIDDFGYTEDKAPDLAPEFGCGDMSFTPYEPYERVLDLYGITTSEYEIICDKLEVEMHIGKCGWCA